MNIRDLLGNGQDRPPAPEVADADDVAKYSQQWAQANPLEATRGRDLPVDPEEAPFAKADEESLGNNVKHRAKFPWLSDPSRGVRWDFSPIQLRNLSQTNTWVGMLVQTISKEIAETPWTIVGETHRAETQKRLATHPEERTPIAKQDGEELPDATAETIHDLLMRPNPDDTWQDMVEMWMGDLLEIGSLATVKAFHRSAYDGDEFTADPTVVEPRALQPTAPEVWTKGYDDRTGLVEGYWQFDDHRAPGSGDADGSTVGFRGGGSPDFFDTVELLWSDMTPRTNRRYGIPPTLLVEDFLQSLDLAVTQEQQYLSRGSIPSGAWVFEEWDREHMKERRQEMEENVKGKPHKSLMFAGQGGDVRFEAMSMNFQELEFTERMKWYARVVASAFQVPTAVVGIEPERVNYNTFQGERENFESNTLGPYLQKLERIINHDLITPHWGGDYRFEFKPGMSESTRKMISDRVTREFSQGIRTRNEARREVGLEPVEDEDDEGFKSEVAGPEDGAGGGGALEELGLSQSDATGADTIQKQDIPDNAYTIDDPSECGGNVVQGPQGGTYCVPDGGDGDGPDGGDDEAIVESVSDLPPELNPENAEEVEDFSGGRQGIDEDMRVARMPDGNDLLVKPDPESGMNDVVGANAIAAIGGNSPETAYVESEDAVIQTLEGEGTVEEIPADQESYTETFAATAAIGDADPNAGNFVADRNGEVSNVDPEAIMDLSEGWVRDEIRREIEEQYSQMDYATPEDAVEAVNDKIDDLVEDVDVDELEEELPDSDTSDQVVENVRFLQQEQVQFDLSEPSSIGSNPNVSKAGAAVQFANAGGPAFERRATLIDFCDDLAAISDGGVFVGESQYPDEMTGDLDGQPVRAVGCGERKATAVWARYRDDAVALSGPHPVDEVQDVVAGNADLRKDEALRETDEWYQFDVQPGMVEDLQAQIADDVRAVFDEVLSDDEVQSIIERLADDETEKSLAALSRRLRELFSDSDVAARVQQALREETASAARETVEETLDEAADAPAQSDVDVEAIEARLADREVEFADAFAEEMRDDILDTVGDGWAEGKGTQDIADEIAEQADINEGWNGAERIARQELHVATGEARSEVAADLDKVEVWQTAGDNRVRDAHAEMQGAWKRPGENWEVEYPDRGVQKESVPGDSEPGIGCRCTTLLRDAETVDDDDHAGV